MRVDEVAGNICLALPCGEQRTRRAGAGEAGADVEVGERVGV